MAPLVESVIALEEKADDLVAQARQAAKDVDKKAQAEIASSRQEIEEVVKRQIETFRREAEKKHQEDLQRADKEFESAMAALDRIDPAVIARYPHQKRSMERLAAYLIRASFSQERMDYLPEEAAVICHSKDGKEKKTYDALEWIAAMGTHVPADGKVLR